MKLTDYVAQFLRDQGIRYVFGLTGGAVVHLFDSIEKTPGITSIFNHHEQASAFAAGGYSRITKNVGAAIVTTGPGGTNAITGLCGAWLDSIPVIFISGQSRLAHTSHNRNVRQLGTQELDITTIVKSITKYSILIEDPLSIKYHLQKAAYISRNGRPGPVWIDIPLDIQLSDIDIIQLQSFVPPQEHISPDIDTNKYIKLIKNAQRPLLLAGYGIRLANAEKEFIRLSKNLNCPFLTTWNISDMTFDDDNFYIGRPGLLGQRGANFAIQNCDLLLSIGSHLPIGITGTIFENFARDALKIVVDIDQNELDVETVKIDYPLLCDSKIFLLEMLKYFKPTQYKIEDEWIKMCIKYKNYNKIPHFRSYPEQNVNPYIFINLLSDVLNEHDIIVIDGGGTIVQIAFQALKIKKSQRVIIDSGLCAMGSGIPSTIGVCFGNKGMRTICLCGDGSMQLNIQELQTIAHHNLPIKIFVFNNRGYLAIRHTQDGFLNSKYIGTNSENGMSLPNIQKIAHAFGIQSIKIDSHNNSKKKIQDVLDNNNPMICEIMVSEEQQINPKIGFDENDDGSFTPRPLEDMYPFLDNKKFCDAMVITPLR